MQNDDVLLIEPQNDLLKRPLSNQQILQRDKLTLKRNSLIQIPASLPKLTAKDLMLPFDNNIEEPFNDKFGDSVRVKTSGQISSRAKVFKSFINQLDQQQRKINSQTMNLLGLQVRKLGCTDKGKSRLMLERQKLEEFQQQTALQNQEDSRMLHVSNNSPKENYTISVSTRQIDKFNPIDLMCKKMDIARRDLPVRWQKAIGNKNSFRMKQKVNFVSAPKKPMTASQRPSRPKINDKIAERLDSASNNNNNNISKKPKVISNPEFINPIYEGRFAGYRQFIFKMNFVHNVYTDFTKYDQEAFGFTFKSDMKYRAYVGPGNNCKLIKSLIKRRFWWIVTDDSKQIQNTQFVWTQLKVKDLFKKQESAPYSNNSAILEHQMTQSTTMLERSSSASPMKRRNYIRKKMKQALPEQQHFYKVFSQKQSLFYTMKMLNNGNKSFVEKSQILRMTSIEASEGKTHNHLINNFYLGNKKALFYNLKQFYELIQENPFKRIPLTFHIKQGFRDVQYKRFASYYKKRQLFIRQQEKLMESGQQIKRKMRNIWIVKPGELTNRGNGITVIDQMYELNSIIKREAKHQNGSEKTFIVQLYIDRPFLYQKRKFDIRHYILITHLHGIMRGYWFDEGYIRTCSYDFDIDNFEREIHLTNDAVQKHTAHYGRYETANKISYCDFQRYLDATYPKKKYNFAKTILPLMKQISLDAIKSSFLKLSPQRLKHNFEIFGLDFMIDHEFKPWLIQINTNPCLEINCPLLAKVIPQMIDQAMRLSLDVIYPPPCHYPNTQKHFAPEAGLQSLKFQLIFDQRRDGPQIRALYKKNTPDLLQEIGEISDDEVYDDEGKDIQLDEVLNT